MNSDDLKAIIAAYGTRICSISMDNGDVILFGYGDFPEATEIEFEKFGSTEMFAVKRIGKSQRPKITFKAHYNPEGIRRVDIVDEEFKGYRIDPIVFR